MSDRFFRITCLLAVTAAFHSCKSLEEKAGKDSAAGQGAAEMAVPVREKLMPVQIYDKDVPSDSVAVGQADAPYVLKKGDRLEISVLDEPEMGREVFILPDGSINYLLVGQVKAAGKSADELADLLAERLSKYIKDPKVSVIIQDLHTDDNEEFVSVVGAVQKPGRQRIRQGDRLLDAITDAGGLLFINDLWGGRSVANLNSAYISRNGEILDVSIYKLLREGDMDHNILVRPGDFIFFPESDTSNLIVLGEVDNPNIIPFTRDISLLEAISRCGGFTERAQKGKVIVLRMNGNETEMRKVDLDAILNGREKMSELALKAGDIVFVPEQGLSEYERYAQYLTTFANLILQGYQAREQIRFPRIHRRDSSFY